MAEFALIFLVPKLTLVVLLGLKRRFNKMRIQIDNDDLCAMNAVQQGCIQCVAFASTCLAAYSFIALRWWG
jgi:hypothetical protein